MSNAGGLMNMAHLKLIFIIDMEILWKLYCMNINLKSKIYYCV